MSFYVVEAKEIIGNIRFKEKLLWNEFLKIAGFSGYKLRTLG